MRIKFFLIAIFFTLTSLEMFGQEKQLFGFGELDWYSSRDNVKDLMKSQYNLLPGYEKDDALGYQGGHYFGEDLFLWVYYFDAQGLNQADLVIKAGDRKSDGIFYELVHTLSGEYGSPDMYKPDEQTAEWYYYDLPGKKLDATIKVSPYSNDKMTTIKITFLKVQ
jgi:hypothetical protein